MKRARRSKTLWWNSCFVLVLGLLELAAQTFSMFIPPIVYSGLIFISSAGNMILRVYTSESIK